MSSNASRLAFVASLLLAKLLVAPEPLAASTLTVTNLGDSGAPGQLRTLMNLAALGDTIVIPAGTITLTGTVGENANLGGDLDIGKPLTIQGAGPGTTIIDGGGIERVMTILNSAGSVTISNLTIRNGKDTLGAGLFIGSGNTVVLTNLTISGNTAQGSSALGGGIANSGSNVTLTNVTISGNSADSSAGSLGGGILNLSGGLTLTNVTISNNTSGASGSGGGIFNFGTVTMTNVTITGNSALSGGGIGLVSGSTVATVTMNGGTISGNTASGFAGGGGISNLGGVLTLTNVTLSGNTTPTGGGINVGGVSGHNATTTLTNVTLSGNTATSASGGGGIYNSSLSTVTMTGGTISGNTSSGGGGGGIMNSAILTLTNVTLSGNTASGNAVLGPFGGGGIKNNFGGNITLTNVTISNNTVVSSIASTRGGGIENTGPGATATLMNVLLSGNTTSGSARNCGNSLGTFTSLGHNLDSGTTCNFAGPGDLSNANPQLGPLQNNGGSTQTHALLPGSPAINAGTNSGCPSTDQRGFVRPQGTTCDIGAFEFGVIVAAVALNGATFHTGQEITYQATLNPGLTPTQVDIYLGALLPDQATFLSLVQSSPGVITIALGPAPVPFLTNQTLAPLAVPFNFTFTGPEPVGTYFPFAGLAVAGSNPFVPASQLSLGLQSFQFSP